jgi:putative ABC transport system permease protein
MYSTILGFFASVAMALAAIGIYGVMAYSVTQRTQEIGIRMALGAQRRDIMRLVLGESTALTILGIGLGTSGAIALTRYLEGLLFGLNPRDPTTFVVTTVTFAVVATLAAYLPARNAARVEPLDALRRG